MIIGLFMIAIQIALFYFAIVGIKSTINRHQGSHGMIFIRDIFKYIALLIAVLITCFGLSGLLSYALDTGRDLYMTKLELARWMSFTVIGIPVVAVIARWIRKDFSKNPEARSYPAWQVYLLVATSASLVLWFIPLQDALRTIAGGPYLPRTISQAMVAFLVWVLHILLLRHQSSILTNIHRFIGWFVGLTGVAISLISFVDSGVSKLMDLEIGKYQLAEAVILLVTSIPVAAYYVRDFGDRADVIQTRIFRTVGGLAVPALFITIAATFVLNTVLVWYFGDHPEPDRVFFNDFPDQVGAVAVLSIVILTFRSLTSGFERDDLQRVYQYLFAGSTLIAGSVGFGSLIAGALDSHHRANTMLFGLSLMATTCPNWAYQWQRCQHALRTNMEVEKRSPFRRAYLYIFVGAPTILAIGASVWLTYNAFKALLVGNQMLADSRVPIAGLATTLLVALYHLLVLRRERD